MIKEDYKKYFLHLIKHKRDMINECKKACKDINNLKFSNKIMLHIYGITHDLSKFLPSEFIPFAIFKTYFEKGCIASIKNNDANEIIRNFLKATKTHHIRNKDHWQHWILPIKNNIFASREYSSYMEYKYLLQMYCRMSLRSRELGYNSVQEYYLNKYDEIILNRNSRIYFEEILGLTGPSILDFTEPNYYYIFFDYTLKEMFDCDKVDINIIKKLYKNALKYGIDLYKYFNFDYEKIAKKEMEKVIENPYSIEDKNLTLTAVIELNNKGYNFTNINIINENISFRIEK